MFLPSVLFALFSLALTGADTDPSLGTWQLNWTKSRSLDRRPKNVIRTYRESGSEVTVSEVWTYFDGSRERLLYTAGYDGRDYPVDSRQGATVTFRRINLYTVEGESKTNGKTDYSFKRTVAKDGKTLIIEILKTDPAGKPYTERLVYEKVQPEK